MLVQRIFIALFVLLEGEVSCEAEDNDEKLAQAHNHFGLKLLQELSRENPKSNLFVSPTSISVALAMVYAGARGKSEVELSIALGHSAAGLSSRESVLASYEKILVGLAD
ncbi:hypothetical protein HPB47_008285 [Ixodes persulcatus]|uniref:Uncharacterized protein n=1 Tax=Ixodes persulcatus TaxID=34615 RepID=A0AC60P547_IXOPE|nr:hypothetical protein HPB47_008285 [Ixodes persulcatus]